jgi:exopolysaccharide biosynthesis protein
VNARHPRSAVGLTSKGEWVFLAVDGRNGMHSSGATISELTEIMRAKNIVYALNLDGGGSTEIIIDGRIYNMPSDGYERSISYALGAISR